MDRKVENLSVKRGNKFTIILESNPTTGFMWLPTFNESVISIISHDFQPSSAKAIGRGGNDIFTFLAMNYGSDELKMTYKRRWDRHAVTEKLFLVHVV